MKVFLKFLEVIFTIVYVVWNLMEILAIPALFLIIGLLNSFPWQYYAATIGGYFIIAIVIQIICHFIFKHFEKKYESALMRLFKKYLTRNLKISNNVHSFVCKHGADSPEDSGYCQLPSIPRDKSTLTVKIMDCFCTTALYGSIL